MRAHALDQRIRFALTGAVVDDARQPIACEPLDDGCTDPLSAAGDDGDALLGGRCGYVCTSSGGPSASIW